MRDAVAGLLLAVKPGHMATEAGHHPGIHHAITRDECPER